MEENAKITDNFHRLKLQENGMPEKKRRTSGNEGYENIPIDELVMGTWAEGSHPQRTQYRRKKGENLTPFQENLAPIQTRRTRITGVVKMIERPTEIKK